MRGRVSARSKGSGLFLGRGDGCEFLQKLDVVSGVKGPAALLVERLVAAGSAFADSSSALGQDELGLWCCASKGVDDGERVAPLSPHAVAGAGGASNRRRLAGFHGVVHVREGSKYV